MIQLIVGGVYLPETSHDRYRCYPEQLGEQIDMISGRRVVEVRGNVQKIEWSYDYLTDPVWKQLAAVLRSGRSFSVTYLADDGDEMQTGTFLCESMENPVFAFSRYGEPFWHNISFVLREVKPHD